MGFDTPSYSESRRCVFLRTTEVWPNELLKTTSGTSSCQNKKLANSLFITFPAFLFSTLAVGQKT